MDGLIPHTVFDTRAFARDTRFEAWRSSIGVVFDTVLPEASDPSDFNARVDASVMGQLLIGRTTSDALSFERSDRRILADGLDHYLVQVVLHGQSEVGRNGHAQVARPGDLYIFDATVALSGALTEPTSHLSLIVPRDLIATDLALADGHHCRIVPREAPMARLLVNFISSLEAARTELTVADAAATQAPLLSLLGSVLNSQDGMRPAEPDAAAVDVAALRVARNFIEQNLSRDDLGPALVSTALGLSRSQLYRLFEHLGGVATYIRGRRLRRSLQDLLDQSHRTMLISEIAFRWGFTSESQYSRAFKSFYGCRPSEARAARNVMVGPKFEATADRVETYARWIRDLAR